MANRVDDEVFGFQIAPMLDVLFVLLLFFMVSVDFPKHEAAITTPLPGYQQGPSEKVPVTVEINADGQVVFNGAPTDTPADHQLPETMTRLRAAMADSPSRPVIISPAPGARHQRVIDVLNACLALHIKNVAFTLAAD
jgi:biopolymer transport protein ExbD